MHIILRNKHLKRMCLVHVSLFKILIQLWSPRIKGGSDILKLSALQSPYIAFYTQILLRHKYLKFLKYFYFFLLCGAKFKTKIEDV